VICLLIHEWEAALTVTPDASDMITSWRDQRLAYIAAERSRTVVRHQDLAVWVP